MADDLRNNRRALSSLITYLEVSYLDSNGPSNLEARVDPESLRRSPPFDPSIALQSPRVVGEIFMNAKDLEMSNTDLKTRYLKVAATLQKHLKTPVEPEAGWKELEVELENYVKGFD
jgi:hypothetical protein